MTKKSKGLFSKFMDLVSEEVPEKGTKGKQTNKGAEATGDVPTQVLDFDASSVPDRFRTKTISTSSTTIQGSFNEEFYNHFQNEIEKNDLEGADYYEFRKTYEVLKNSMPEIAALNATFQALCATSPELTVDTLLETAQFYLDLISKEHDGFENQFNEKIATEIHGREAAIENETNLQAEKLAQIEALQAEIVESESKVGGLIQEKNVEEHKLNEVKANWDYTIELVKNNINTDVKNINTYLVGTKTV
jgi:hypothetical protein